jgi:ATP-binding cassette subfamily B protein
VNWSVRFHLRQISRTLALLWRSSKGWSSLTAVLAAVQSVLPLLALAIFARLLEEVEHGLSSPDADNTPLVLLIVLAVVIALSEHLAQGLSRYVQEAHALTLGASLQDSIQEKMTAIDLRTFDDPSLHDLLYRAQRDSATRPAQIVRALAEVTTQALALIGIVIYLISLQSSIGLALILASVPGVLSRLFYAQRLYQWDRQRSTLTRKVGYLNWLLTHVRNAREVRIFGLGRFLRSRYDALNRQFMAERLGLLRVFTLTDMAANTAMTLALYVVLAGLIIGTQSGNIALSVLVVAYQAFQRAQAALNTIVAEAARVYENNLYLATIFELLDLPVVAGPPNPEPVPAQLRTGISVEGVTFSYPGSRQPALRDVSLFVRPGEVIALVGENGSGKSTLIKLLCGLYAPDTGRLCLENIDYREYDPAALRTRFSPIFQDYVWYQLLTVRENVTLGAVDIPVESERVTKALRESGAAAFVERLPDGDATLLGREFENGSDLSVGQWQKIALARAIYRDSPIIILDEPSSALDPLAEADVFEQFHTLRQGRTAILVSHRLSNVLSADCIYVLQDGRIVERGTHPELMTLPEGVYQRMFRVQQKGYLT